MQLPIAPSSLSTQINSANKTINLMNDGEVNLLKKPGLTDFSFELLLPNVRYPFATYPNGFQKADYYLEKIEKLKVDLIPFQFIVSRMKPNGDLLFDTNVKVSLEDYEIIEDAENGFDITVKVNLKQYREYGNKKVALAKKADDPNTTTASATQDRPANKPIPKTHTVVKGDTLWAICKKILGNGSKVEEIAKLNGIKNSNLIYPGQVIKLG